MPLNPSDDDLLRRLRAGDQAAFTTLYQRWQGPLFRFVTRMTGSPAVAEDVVQEVFLVMMRESARFDPERGTVAGWLYGVARNHVLRRLDRERPYLPLGDTEPASSAPDVIQGIEQDERTRAVWSALLALPPHYREVVVLCDMQELEYVQAAEVLGCVVGTVRSRLHRARTMLAERLRPREAMPALREARR